MIFLLCQAFETPETTPEERAMSPAVIESANTLLKRSNTVASYLARSLKASNEPPHRKVRIAADEANEKYRSAVYKLDGQRLVLEDRIESMLKQVSQPHLIPPIHPAVPEAFLRGNVPADTQSRHV